MYIYIYICMLTSITSTLLCVNIESIALVSFACMLHLKWLYSHACNVYCKQGSATSTPQTLTAKAVLARRYNVQWQSLMLAALR